MHTSRPKFAKPTKAYLAERKKVRSALVARIRAPAPPPPSTPLSHARPPPPQPSPPSPPAAAPSAAAPPQAYGDDTVKSRHHGDDDGHPIANCLTGLKNATEEYLLSLSFVSYNGPPTKLVAPSKEFRESGEGVMRLKVNPFGVSVSRVRVPLAAR